MKDRFKLRGSYLSYVLTYFSFYFSMGVFVGMLSVYLTGIGKTTSEMTWIMSASSLFGIVLIPLVGYLIDWFRKPKLITAITLTVVAICGVLFAFSKNTWILYVLNGCIMGFISSISPICERAAGNGRYRYGMVRIWGTIGFAVATQVAAILLETGKSKWLFFCFSIAAVLAAIGFSATDGINFTAEKEKHTTIHLFSFVGHPMFLLFAAISLLFSATNTLNNTFAPMLLQDLNMPTKFVGMALTLSTLAELPMVFFSNRFMDRFSGKTLSCVCFLLMVLQFGIYGVSTSAILDFCAMLLLKAICSTLFMMLILKVVQGIVPETVVSTAIGVINAVNAISAIVMQNVGGWIVDATSIQALYLVMAGLSALAFVLCIFLKVKNVKQIFS